MKYIPYIGFFGRSLLTGWLLYGAYAETGFYTTAILGLCAFSLEAVAMNLRLICRALARLEARLP